MTPASFFTCAMMMGLWPTSMVGKWREPTRHWVNPPGTHWPGLFWTLEGRLEEEPSLLWQGMAYLDLYFWLYTMDSGRAVQRDRFVLTGERLPVEALDLSDSELRAHFRDVAGKLVQHWEENGAARFVRSVLE